MGSPLIVNKYSMFEVNIFHGFWEMDLNENASERVMTIAALFQEMKS